jgi:hypothetical protein
LKVRISPSALTVSSAVWMPTPDALKRIVGVDDWLAPSDAFVGVIEY